MLVLTKEKGVISSFNPFVDRKVVIIRYWQWSPIQLFNHPHGRFLLCYFIQTPPTTTAIRLLPSHSIIHSNDLAILQKLPNFIQIWIAVIEEDLFGETALWNVKREEQMREALTQYPQLSSPTF